MFSHKISRYIRAICLFAVGFFLVFPFDGFFGAIGSLHVVTLILPLPILGVVAMIGGICILISKLRETGYILGIVISGIIAITSILSLAFTPVPHIATIFFTFVVAASYFEGLSESIKSKYN